MSDSDPASTTTRRRFLDWIIGSSLGALAISVLYPVTRYLIPPAAGESSTASVTLPFTIDDLPINTGRIFKFGNRPGLIVRTATDELRAYSANCTHLGCIVQYRSDLAHVWCACHNGHFDLNGQNIIGPPPTPLETFAVNMRGDQIVISKRS